MSIADLAASLRSRGGELASIPATAGFDGFVDEMIKVVGSRTGVDSWQPLQHISAFGDWVNAAAGKSSLREIVVDRTDAGGCTVNLGDGLQTMGVPLSAFGTLGEPIHSAFEDFVKKCTVAQTWGKEPGRTLALEFDDGKLMLSAVAQLADFTPELLEQKFADGVFLKSCQESKLIALTNWTLYPHMSDCWRKVQSDVFAKLEHKPTLFIDLVDPRSRSEEDIRDMLEALKGFEGNTACFFGGNLNEANAIGKLLGINEVEEEPAKVAEQAAKIREALGLSGVVTHCVGSAAMATADDTAHVTGPFCGKPGKTVGAGDRFNAGWCAGKMLDLPLEQQLLFGVVSSGYFVRAMHSGTVDDLAGFAEKWAEGADLDAIYGA